MAGVHRGLHGLRELTRGPNGWRELTGAHRGAQRLAGAHRGAQRLAGSLIMSGRGTISEFREFRNWPISDFGIFGIRVGPYWGIGWVPNRPEKRPIIDSKPAGNQLKLKVNYK